MMILSVNFISLGVLSYLSLNIETKTYAENDIEIRDNM